MPGPDRTAAEGAFKTLIIAVLVLAALIGIRTWLDPFTQGYEMQSAAKTTCNEAINLFRFGGEPWEAKFVRRATQAGVHLEPEQYSFKVSPAPQTSEFICHARIRYPTKTEWWLVGPYFGIPPLKWARVLEVEHRVRESY
jgi:hypothetical protein